MNILGINAYHGDSAACLLRDGQLVAAAEEERFRRIKHWAGLPTEAIKYCLQEEGIRFGDLDHIAMNRKPGVNNWRRLLFVIKYRPDFSLIRSRIRNIGAVRSIEDTLRSAFPAEQLRAHVHKIEHHLAHLSSAFFVSDFDAAVCVSVDGFGDFASAAWGMGTDKTIQIGGRVHFPHSLGIFYSAITQFLGFPYFGDEYKVMGLAPYGEPRYLEQMRQVVRIKTDGTYELNLNLFHHHTNDDGYTWDGCAPEVGTLYTPALADLLGPERKNGEPLAQRHKDLARSAQAMYEEAFFALLSSLHRKYDCPNLALSGGCAMNSVANGKVYLQSPFKKMYLPAAAGDAGGAIGAAFVVWNALVQSPKSKVQSPKSTVQSHLDPRASSNGHFVMSHAYTGPQFDDAAIETLLRSRNLLHESPITSIQHPGKQGLLSPTLSSKGGEGDESNIQHPTSSIQYPVTTTRYSDPAALCHATAEAIAAGKVVGWFQGRMEWGPRALGNRSILCDPRRADMKAILNAKIKRRESFRPFAPSILREHVRDWFEQDDDVPFMMQVFQVREEKRKLVPAITHVDGSGRLQTVHKDTNPLYWHLISDFCSLTSIPMVLNTSFNENEPVVCKPEEALDCFLRTKMDVLVLGPFVLRRAIDDTAELT